MKLAPILFAVSVVANVAAFAVCVLRPSLAPPVLHRFMRFPPVPIAENPKSLPVPAAPDQKIWPALESSDLRTLIARLRAAGFSPSLIRAMVTAQVEERFKAQVQPLVARVADAPFWRPRPNEQNSGDPTFRDSLHQAFLDRSRLLRDLLGDPTFAEGAADPTAEQRRRFGDLPPAKIERLQRIADDYNQMTMQAYNAAESVMLPEDREKLALLEREKRADIAAVLTTAEFADYALRTSSVTSRLRSPLTLMDASESEFRAIHEAHRKQDGFLSLLNPPVDSRGFLAAEYLQQRDAAYRQIVDELKTTLGEQRQAEFTRASTMEFQELVRFAARENLPRETIVRAFDLREEVARESNRIIDDSALNPEQKRAAFELLVQNTKSRLTATLGPAVATAYLQSRNHWIEWVERGWSISFRPDGNYAPGRTLPTRGN